MAGSISVKVDGLQRINYQAQTGVIIGDEFLTREKFKLWFEELLGAKDSVEYSLFAKELDAELRRMSALGEQEITKFNKNLHHLQQLFLNFTAKTSINGALGGDISLLTTFHFGAGDQNTYFVSKEDALPSRIRSSTGGLALRNSEKVLKDLVDKVDEVQKMNSVFQQHLQNFYLELQDNNTSLDDRKKLYIWAYQNMKNRFNANKDKTPMSLAHYFWGDGHLHGYVTEAYGIHLTLTHSNFLAEEHATELQKSVIEEHGGRGSRGLFALLASTKGNTSSQLSGDIVVVDKDGRVKFNIQSKSSMKSSYGIYITYQQFLTNVSKFLLIYKNWDAKSEKEKQEDLDVLFKAFSTTAWVPLKENLNKNIQTELQKTVSKT